METVYNIAPGMNVALVGFGRAGQGVLRYLAQCGANVLVSDNRIPAELSKEEQALLNECSCEYEGGGHTAAFLGRAEMLIVSPGVAVDHPALTMVADSGVPVLGELALAAGHFTVPVIAITGTNGKTTVTELVGRLLKSSGKKVFVGGNIGTPVCDYLIAPELYEIVVLEVSSFQLETSGSFVPDVAVLLNITPDHLDRHGTFERYIAAKMRLLAGGKTRLSVINGDDPACYCEHQAGNTAQVRFGYSRDYEASIGRNRVAVSGEAGRDVYDLTGCGMATVSGCLNSAAAILAVQQFGVTYEIASQALKTYEPGEHRVQMVAEVNGVVYINDSKATNTGAVNSSLRQVGGDVVLIAGGMDKGDDYRLLRESVRQHVKGMVLLGADAEKLSAALGDLAPVQYAEDMSEAVMLAASAAVHGDTVLLAPACASFDMFNSYIHRGETFAREVEGLKNGKMTGAMP